MKKFEPIYKDEDKDVFSESLSYKKENEIKTDTDMTFISLYTELYNKYFDELEVLRKKQRNVGIAIIVGVITTMILINVFPALAPLFALAIVIFMVWTIVSVIRSVTASIKEGNFNVKAVGKNSSYKQTFKEKIITPIIEYALPEGMYDPLGGLGRSDYVRGEWESFDIFSAEDKIVTKLNVDGVEKEITLVMSEVHTEDESTDSDGNTTYTTIFHGLAGYVNLPKDVGCNIKVIKNRIRLFGAGKNKLEMDMPEFEKLFDVETTDRIKAMQLLTSDVMADFLELVNSSRVKFEFNIKNDIMHIRFHTGNLFEPATFGRSMQLDMLKKYYEIVIKVKEIAEKICTIINETEM